MVYCYSYRVVSRLCSCLIVPRFVWYVVKFVGLVKCILKELAVAFLEVLQNFIGRVGSVLVGSLLLSNFIVFQYIFWLCL